MSIPEEEAPAPTGPRAVFRLVGNRNFGPYFVGNAVSASGTWFQNLAAALLVYRLTHSAFLLGVLNFSQFAAILVLAPWTGSAADRFDRKRLLLVTQVFSAAVSLLLAGLAWAGLVHVVVVMAISLTLGVSAAFAAPLQQALVTSLVEPRDLVTAVSLNSMTFNLARAVGPAIGAVVVQGLGIAPAFALNSLSYLVLVAGLLLVKPRRHRRPERTSLRESLGLVRRQPRLLVLLLVVVSVGFSADPINTLAPAFAHAFGHRDVVGGYLIGVFGAGAVIAAFALAGRAATRRRVILTLILMAGGGALFAATPWFAIALVPLAVAGFGYLASNTAVTTRLQLEVEEHQRGRIMTLWSVAFLGLRPFASLADGGIASAVGVRTAGLVLQLPALAAIALLVVRERRSRT